MLQRAAIAYFALTTALEAQTVAVNSHIVAIPGPPGIHFQVSKYGQPPPFHEDPFTCVDCDTEISFEYDGTRIKVFTILLDEGSDWFHVRPGDIFSAATIDDGRFPTITNVVPPLVPPPQLGEIDVGSGDFYLGVRTADSPGNPSPYFNRTTYGWVHLRPVDGVLTMVENVLSFNSRGIIVGTATVVPEPPALLSMGLGILLFAVFRRGVRVE
jgi:hypothetical protein